MTLEVDMSNTFNATVCGVIQESANLRRFILELNDNFKFKVGQYVQLAIPLSDPLSENYHEVRSYSIASVPNFDNRIELCIKRQENGKISNYLFDQVKIGDVIEARGPLGNFEVEHDSSDEVCFISNDVGIAPMKAMVEDLLENGYQKKVTLISGDNCDNHSLYTSEFEKLQKHFSNFSYLRTDDDKMHSLYRNKFGDGHACDFYLCGHESNIHEIKTRLNSLGYKDDHIHAESWG
jgi:ferredoxin-NADP reductase